MSIASQLIVNGLIAGSIYALVALGYTLVYGVLGFINFAHGEIVMFGAYFAYFFHSVIGMNIILAACLSMICCALMGVVIERVAYRPLRNSPRLVPLITAIAMSLLLQGIALALFSSKVRTISSGISPTYNIFGAVVTEIQLTIFAVTLVVMVLLYFIVKKTKLGKAIRATSDNMTVAKAIGVNTDRVISATFALGSAFAAIAGVLIGIEKNVVPTMGIKVGIAAFSAAVVGGIGNVWGAVAGGFVIGLAENIGIWFIPSGYKDAIAFLILIIILIIRPSGIFGVGSGYDIRKTEN